MSCWVVPTLAAELWGVPLDQVLGQVQSGVIPTKVDYGFVLIDVAPGCDHVVAPPQPVVPPPPTFVAVETSPEAPFQPALSDEEFKALAVEEPARPAMAEPSAEELLALAATAVVSPVEAVAVSAAPRRHRRSGQRLRVPAAPLGIHPSSEAEVEDEAGPDPNFGEVEDDRPLDWRAARSRTALTRRRPSPMRV